MVHAAMASDQINCELLDEATAKVCSVGRPNTIWAYAVLLGKAPSATIGKALLLKLREHVWGLVDIPVAPTVNSDERLFKEHIALVRENELRKRGRANDLVAIDGVVKVARVANTQTTHDKRNILAILNALRSKTALKNVTKNIKGVVGMIAELDPEREPVDVCEGLGDRRTLANGAVWLADALDEHFAGK